MRVFTIFLFNSVQCSLRAGLEILRSLKYTGLVLRFPALLLCAREVSTPVSLLCSNKSVKIPQLIQCQV